MERSARDRLDVKFAYGKTETMVQSCAFATPLQHGRSQHWYVGDAAEETPREPSFPRTVVTLRMGPVLSSPVCCPRWVRLSLQSQEGMFFLFV